MPYAVSGDGTRIYYEAVGHGEPLVLIQGFSWDLATWHFQWELGYRFRLVFVDNRGVGASDKPFGPYSLDQMVGDVFAVVNELGLRLFHLLGFSMGGMIAQYFTLKFNDLVKSLILVSTMPRLRPVEMLRRFIEWLRRAYVKSSMFRALANLSYNNPRAYKTILGIAFSELWILRNKKKYNELANTLFNRRMPFWAFLSQLEVMSVDLTPKLRDIAVPTTIMHGEVDRLIPIVNGRKLFEGIPNSRFVVFPATGHAIYIERPKEFNQQVIYHVELVDNERFKDYIRQEVRLDLQ